MNHIKTFFLMIIIGLITEKTIAQISKDTIPLIPTPENIHVNDGTFNINSSTKINYSNDSLNSDIERFNNYINTNYGFRLKTIHSPEKSKQQIDISISPDIDPDGYRLEIIESGITITSGKNAGTLYALQTLIQLLPSVKLKELAVPQLVIEDKPRFKYRGMHLDVARHFFSVEEVKKYLDFLAIYKMNYFHWHLTDDQGWRIEIKKYPLLQKISSTRKQTLIGHRGDQPERYDSLEYGGFYTQDEIKSVVDYATKLHITILPEIEMPGHALAALAAYPEYSCTGDSFQVGTSWGVFKDVFCPKEETFVFLQNILDEVCALFPGEYIHIGGDECPKDRWKNCPRCQALIKKENLANENDIQRYFTNRIAAYLKTKNKKAIGWDEILEEGLDKDAVIMSWRGYTGGAKAAAKNHDVVMTPSGNCYFDMYQSRFSDGRIAIGGYLPIDQVYKFEPIPDVLNETDAKHIIGAQGNVWSEYIADENRLQEMIFPRICALSEVLWSPKDKRDFENFSKRLVEHFKFLDFLKIKYSTALYDISSKVSPNGNNGINVELFSSYKGGDIYYTLNPDDPAKNFLLYNEKIPIDHSLTLQSFIFENEKLKGKAFTQVYRINKATGKEVILANAPHVEYSRGGGFSLVNGVTGTMPWIPSEWLGFSGKDLDATIDLGTVQAISQVDVDVLKDEEGKIFLPKELKVSISENGTDYKVAGTMDASAINLSSRKLTIKFSETPARWVKVFAKNANDKDFLFVDEIGVE